MVNKVVTLFKSRAFLLTLLIGLFITSILIISAMMLGQESGNFVIRVQNTETVRSITLSETDPNDESTYVNRLTTSGMGNMNDNTLNYFVKNLKERTEVGGVNDSDKNLYCYTFFIINSSETAFRINIDMEYGSVSNNLDSAIRVLTYNAATEDIRVYQKEDTEYFDYAGEGEYGNYQPEYFVSDSIVFQETANLGLDNEMDSNPRYIKYSILFWLEGNDPDCTEKIRNGSIKFNLNISVQG